MLGDTTGGLEWSLTLLQIRKVSPRNCLIASCQLSVLHVCAHSLPKCELRAFYVLGAEASLVKEG